MNGARPDARRADWRFLLPEPGLGRVACLPPHEPELIDALGKLPLLVTASLRALEQATTRPPENPFAGMRGTLFAGFCLVAGAILAAFHGPPLLWGGLFLLGLLLALRRGR